MPRCQTGPPVLSNVAPGTMVRVFNFTGNTASWTVGVNILAIANNKMAEFVFYDDGGTGRWLITQSNVDAKRWP
ncbi:MAG: hypothetical protein JST30_00005 [Armatimonadetes bacterium]|nr:hypothetical protein [Armatimonadota bacterium]